MSFLYQLSAGTRAVPFLPYFELVSQHFLKLVSADSRENVLRKFSILWARNFTLSFYEMKCLLNIFSGK